MAHAADNLQQNCR